jgi:hypothetical protein
VLSKKVRVLSLLGLMSTSTIIVLADLSPISKPPDPSKLRPVERIPRTNFGVVGNFPLAEKDLNALVYPSTSRNERNMALPGLTFFTTPHTAAEGLGPIANQRMCLGCHMNSNEVFSVDKNGNRLLTSVSQVSRAVRATPTNFDFVGFNPLTGGGRAADHLDAIGKNCCIYSLWRFLSLDPDLRWPDAVFSKLDPTH